MLKFGNKEFRNLQEQVKKNMDDILFILQEEGVLNEFGIKVVGQEASVIDMPTVADYKEDNPDWSYGDAYAIGTEEPYELYILTRANGTHPNDYWFNIGEFPAPGPQGPQGEQGEVGPQGPTGNPGANGISPQLGVGNVVVETLESDQDATVAITESGTQANPIWNFNFGIPKGQDGSAVTSVAWGDITGSLANQTDLVSALQAKANASALASYATQVYANNVASNATYQANVYTDSKISALSSAIAGLSSVYAGLNSNNAFAGINSFSKSIGLLSSANIVVTDANQSEYTINIPRVSGTMALTNDIPSLSGYATQSWVSSNFLSIGTPIGGAAVWGSISGTLANQTDLMNKFSEYATISQVSSAISALDYASVGALSSETYIPRVGGDNDGTYWTAITLGDDTYAIPQGGISSVAWGSISGTLSNQTDLQTALDNKVDKEVTSGDDSSSIDINETVIGLYASDPDTNSSLEISKDGVVIQANDDVKGTSTQLTVSDGSVTITRDSDSASIDLFDLASRSYVDASISALSSVYQPIGDYATVSALSSAVSDINSTISSLDYASVGALSSATVIPNYSAGDWIGISNSTISVYNPYVSLMSDGLPRILMATSTYNGAPDFISQYVDINPANGFRVNDRRTSTGNKYTTYGHDAIIFNSSYTYNFPRKSGTFALTSDIPSAQTIPSARSGITLVGNYYGLSTTIPGTKTFTGSVTFNSNAIFNDYADFNNAVTFNSRTYFPDGKFMYGSDLTTGFEQQLQSKSGTIALLDDIPSVSEYATISALSSAVSDINSTISGLSSVYAPIGYLPSGVSGYASEVWTFTLSDNTTVSKTILVG